MKKIVYILLTAFIFTNLLSSCKESFLDQEKPLVSTEAIVFTDAAKTEAALLGLYATLKGSDCNYLGGRTYVVFDNRGWDIDNIDPNGVTLAQTFAMAVNQTQQENKDTWYYGYQAINRANVFIQSVEDYKTADVIGADKAKQYVAEAKFVRALSYYYMLQLYSEPYKVNKSAKALPLRLTAIKGSGQSDCASSTISKVYEQILTDINDSEIAALSGDVKQKTRATKAAAYMLRMRVYMAMENWSAAITAGNAVTGYTLVSDVAAQFKSPFYTDENIFSLPMSTNDRPNTQRSSWEFYNTGRICIIQKSAPGVMSMPNYSIAKDKRVVAFDQDGKVGKWTDPSDGRLKWHPIFRFAETKLNLAECYARSSNVDAAITALSDVRRRSIAEADDKLDVSTLAGSALLEAIALEKRLEFLGEGLAGIEIIRKGESFRNNTGPGNPYYTWPFPEAERVNNALWDQLEP